MADGASVKVDASGWQSLLENLDGPIRVSLARSMAVAGGKIVRDEAKARAPLGPTGLLADSIYLAFRDKQSKANEVQYSVTWNKSTAPHGHLIEFGHWQIHPAVLTEDGVWISNKKVKLSSPKWVTAHPFLRPAYEATRDRVAQAMIDRAKQRLPELLSGISSTKPTSERVIKVPGAAVNLLRN